jgi:hypothetical protein
MDRTISNKSNINNNLHNSIPSPTSTENNNMREYQKSSEEIKKFTNFIFDTDPNRRHINVVRIHANSKKTSGFTFLRKDRESLIAHVEMSDYDNKYWTPNKLKKPVYKKPTKNDIENPLYAHLDIDPDPNTIKCSGYEHARKELLDEVQELIKKYRPSIVIDSGNGIQLFWRYKNLLSNEDGEAINKQLIDKLGGDKGTHNIDRIMRFPGTLNYPTMK